MNEPLPNNESHLKSGVFHLRSLTGMRFMAAFAVYVSHTIYFIRPIEKQLPLGGPAVSFFFVLSGFILTYVYAGRLHSSNIGRFYLTRLARLWPVHLLCLAAAVFFAFHKPGVSPAGDNSWASLIAQAFMLHSWLPMQHWFTDFNSVSWSISTEMFFYLCFPLLLLGNKRWFTFGLKFFVVTAIAFTILLSLNFLIAQKALPSWVRIMSVSLSFPPVRLFEFVFGMATCLLMKKLNIKFVDKPSSNRAQYIADSLWELIALSSIVIAWMVMMKLNWSIKWIQNPKLSFAFGNWLRVAGGVGIFAFTIFTFARCRGLLGQILGSRLGVWLGEISFAFYLIHQVVIIQLTIRMLDDRTLLYLSFFITLFLSGLMFMIVEMPVRNAVLGLYDRKPGWFGKGMAGLKTLVTTPAGWFQAACLTGLIVVCFNIPTNQKGYLLCGEIVQNTADQGLKNVRFQSEARLIGIDVLQTPRGMRIRMAWVRERNQTRHRFIHICGKDGKILSHGDGAEMVFMNAMPNEPFVDEVFLPHRALKYADYVAIGFWSKEMQCSPIISQKTKWRDWNGFRLKIADMVDYPRTDLTPEQQRKKEADKKLFDQQQADMKQADVKQ